MKNSNMINELSGEDAKRILMNLANEDKKLAERINKLAEEFFTKVDFSEISDSVFSELDDLEVEELWDHSGRTRHGYVEPCEEAYNMVEQVLDQYTIEYDKFIRLNKRRPAMEYMLGIISGLMEFDANGRSEFRDWAEDVADDFIQDYIGKFKSDEQNAGLVDEFMQRIEKLKADYKEI